MKYIFLILLTYCTKTYMGSEHISGQHYEIWSDSKVQTDRPGGWCPINIVAHKIDTLYWNIENPDTRDMLNSAHQDSIRNGIYYLTVHDSLIAYGTTYGPLK